MLKLFISKFDLPFRVQFKGVSVEAGNILDGPSMFKDIEFIVKNIKTAHVRDIIIFIITITKF